jgi:hypothetical protein
MEGGRWNFSFWSSVYLWGLNFKVAPQRLYVLLLHWAVQQFFFLISGFFSTTLRAFVTTYKWTGEYTAADVIRKPWCVFNFLHSHSCHSYFYRFMWVKTVISN